MKVIGGSDKVRPGVVVRGVVVVALSASLAMGCQAPSAGTSAQPSRTKPLTSASTGTATASGNAVTASVATSPIAVSPLAITTTRPCGVASAAPRIDHVVWIIMENHGRGQIVNNTQAAYFNSLRKKCGYASNAHAITHPSLPNYIAMTSGGTQGVTDDANPAAHRLSAANLFSQLGSGRWRTLAESMPSACYRSNSGTYVPRHNPATYFTNVASQCATQNIRLTATPSFSAPFTLIVPDQRSNTHDTSIAYGDQWLARFVPKVINSAQYQSGRTVLFITYDEDENAGNTSNPIATLVISPRTPAGRVSTSYFTHYSLLRTTEELLGLPLLGKARAAYSMKGSFRLG